MVYDSSQHHAINAPYNNVTSSESKPSKPPRLILDGLYACATNRETLGGTSYFILENTGNILVDCPAWSETNQEFLRQQGVKWLFITHRGGMGKNIKQMQSLLGCEVVIQEQEAYLLPEVDVTSFEQQVVLSSQCHGFWTPGHSPGSSCVYCSQHGGVLFSGRHILPNQQGYPVPLRTAKTFHWPRQLRSLVTLRSNFTPQTLTYICPGANTGFLRGKGMIENAYELLSQLDIDSLQQTPILF